MGGAALLPASWDAGDTRAAWPFTRLMVRAAALAYGPPETSLPALRALGLEPEFIDRRATQAYATRAGADALVAFRGTETAVDDVLTDLRIIRTRTRHGGVHAGFWSGYEHVHGQVSGFAERVAGRGGRVWLTGHSLGGALAVVAAYRLLHGPRVPIGGVVTFGQPMVVMPELADALYPSLRDRFVRFVNGDDRVPGLVRPYVQFGTVIRRGRDGFERRDVRPGGRGPSVSRDVAGAVPPPPPTYGIGDLDWMIRRLEAGLAGAAGGDAALSQGVLPWVADHALSAYSALVEAFVDAGAPPGSPAT